MKQIPGGPDLEEGFELARKAIQKASRVLLVCHVAPDGDAIGSMLAMKHYLSAMGVSTVASFPHPFVLPPSCRHLPGAAELVKPEEAARLEPDLVMTFDSASRERVGEFSRQLEAAADVVVIDHHDSNPGYGTVNLVVPEASSSSEIVYDFLAFLGAELTVQIAECLYVGISTDTGRFQYQNTSPRVFAMCAELASVGLDIAGISRKVFEETRFQVLRLLGKVLDRAVLDEQARCVYSWFDHDELRTFGVHAAETEDFIDVLRRTEEADVAFLVKEINPGEFKASVRSLGRVDVAEVASRFGGGGHKMAAGFTSRLGVDGTVQALLEVLRSWQPPES